MSHTKTTSSIRSFIGLAVGLSLTAIAMLLVINRQYVYDVIAYHQYEPTAAVAEIADRTTMTDAGKFYFYTSHPRVDGAQAFNDECNRHEESSAILGCYSNNRIFVYDVTDEQLDGIKEVTAAHEMLHAVYQRMPDDEKRRVNQLLQAEYAKHSDDKELADRMAFYDRNEPGQENNELHSILGTEFSGFSAELEAYYTKYFSNRQAVVDLHTKYATVFKNNKLQTEQIIEQLNTLGASIEKRSYEYNIMIKALNSDIQSFNKDINSGVYTSVASANSDRNKLQARSSALEQTRTSLSRDLATYDKLREEYKVALATHNKLYESLDSNLAPTPSV